MFFPAMHKKSHQFISKSASFTVSTHNNYVRFIEVYMNIDYGEVKLKIPNGRVRTLLFVLFSIFAIS